MKALVTLCGACGNTTIPFGRVQYQGPKAAAMEQKPATTFPPAMQAHPSSARRSHKNQPGSPIKPAAKMPVVHPPAAGIAIGATAHWVCVPADAVPGQPSPAREFGAFTRDLEELVEWLLACRVQTVAMESPGGYWLAWFQKLEQAGIEAILVNARHGPGRKTDMKDGPWLQQVHSYGRLNGSFRPAADICCLRSRMRQWDNWGQSCKQQVQHMQPALNYRNVHLPHTVNDLTGETGMRIVDAILRGQQDPKELVKLRDPQITKSTEAAREAALRADWREEHLFVLRQSLENYRHPLKQIAGCDAAVEKVLARVVINPAGVPDSERPANPPAAAGQKQRKKFKCRKQDTGLKQGLSAELARICGVDLTRVIGLDVLGVLIVIAEIGGDMRRWRGEKAFCAWPGLCPGNKSSGGRILSSHTTHAVNRVATLLRTVAPSVGGSETWLGIFHRRMKGRLGPAGANTATARKLAWLICHLLKYKEAYIDVDRWI
jgi:transposase